jgi:hypothetical protein
VTCVNGCRPKTLKCPLGFFGFRGKIIIHLMKPLLLIRSVKRVSKVLTITMPEGEINSLK